MKLPYQPELPKTPRPVVILGAGGIVNDAHLPAYRMAGFPVASIYNRTVERAQKLADKFGIKSVYDNVAAAVASAPKNAVFDLALMPAQFIPTLEQLPEGAPVGLRFIDYRGTNDPMIYIKITPNRPDALGVRGIARDLAARGLGTLKPQVITPVPGTFPCPITVTIDPALRDTGCPLFAGRLIRGVKNGPSPAWLQDRLRAIGLRPISALVDITNFFTFDLNRPLHVFDAAKVAGDLRIHPAQGGETLLALDGKTYTLRAGDMAISDDNGVESLAGIMGGENSGVADDTTDLVLEVAAFRRQSVRATSRKLGLSSDSSYRFERGIDVHSLPEATRRALALTIEFAGGQICGETLRVGSDVPWEREITFTPAWVCSRLGFDVSNDDQRSALEALDLLIVREDETPTGDAQWTVRIPSWRSDLDRPIDLVEEILRVHGTAKIPAKTVTGPGLLAEDDPIAEFNRRVGTYLIGQNFNECVTYTLRSKLDVASWGGDSTVDALGLANPFVEDQSHLRPSIISGLLDSLRLNQSRGNPVTGLFETGRVFIPKEGGVQECAAVGFVIAENDDASWLKRESADFYLAKRLIETIAGAASTDLARQPHLATDDEASTGWQAGHHTLQGNMAYGWTARYGLLDLAHLKAVGVEGKVYAGVFAILPERLAKGGKRRRFQPFSLQPAALRDVALVVAETEQAGTVLKELTKLARSAAKGFELEDVALFDVYQGKGLPEGKKSLAFSLTFRAPDRTLTDEEVNKAFNTVLEQIAAKTAYAVRQ